MPSYVITPTSRMAQSVDGVGIMVGASGTILKSRRKTMPRYIVRKRIMAAQDIKVIADSPCDAIERVCDGQLPIDKARGLSLTRRLQQ